jgi:hypothetical protein
MITRQCEYQIQILDSQSCLAKIGEAMQLRGVVAPIGMSNVQVNARVVCLQL